MWPASSDTSFIRCTIVFVGACSLHQTAAVIVPTSPLMSTVVTWSRRDPLTGVMSNPKTYPAWLAHSTCTGKLSKRIHHRRWLKLTCCPTRMTIDTSATIQFTYLTDLIISGRRDGGNAFRWFQGFGVAEFYLWRENGTGNVNPIIVCCTLQWLSRIDRFVHFFLPFPEEICSLLGSFAFYPITFAILLRFLSMGQFRWLYKVNLCVFNRAEHAFVLLRSLVQETSIFR